MWQLILPYNLKSGDPDTPELLSMFASECSVSGYVHAIPFNLLHGLSSVIIKFFIS